MTFCERVTTGFLTLDDPDLDGRLLVGRVARFEQHAVALLPRSLDCNEEAEGAAYDVVLGDRLGVSEALVLWVDMMNENKHLTRSW